MHQLDGSIEVAGIKGRICSFQNLLSVVHPVNITAYRGMLEEARMLTRDGVRIACGRLGSGGSGKDSA
jgi:hypothetical protein